MRHRLLFCVISVVMVGADVSAEGGCRAGVPGQMRREVACAARGCEAGEESAAGEVARCVKEAVCSDEDLAGYNRYSILCLSERHSAVCAACVTARCVDEGRDGVRFYNTGENRLRVSPEDVFPD